MNDLPDEVNTDWQMSVVTPGDPPYYPDFPTQDYPVQPNALPASVLDRVKDIGGRLLEQVGDAALKRFASPQNNGSFVASSNAPTSQPTRLPNILPPNFSNRAFATLSQPMVLIIMLVVVVFGFALLGRK